MTEETKEEKIAFAVDLLMDWKPVKCTQKQGKMVMFYDPMINRAALSWIYLSFLTRYFGDLSRRVTLIKL